MNASVVEVCTAAGGFDLQHATHKTAAEYGIILTEDDSIDVEGDMEDNKFSLNMWVYGLVFKVFVAS